MNGEEILKKIEELGPWFHAIDLGNGIVTKKQSVAGSLLTIHAVPGKS